MDKRVTPLAHYVKLTSGGHTLGRSERPHATASIDPKGYSRMRGTAADRSVHHPWVLLSGGTGDRNAATEPKVVRPNGRHGGTRKGRRRRNLPHSPSPHHWTPLAGGTGDSEAVMGTQTQDSNKLPIGV